MTNSSRFSFYLGIDGGGTHCRARIQSHVGRCLGEGHGGPANIRLGLDVVWPHIMDAVDAALVHADLGRQDLPNMAVGLGLAGLTTQADCARTIAHGPRFGYVSAATDAHIACLGAFGGQDGAILIVGTGSAGYAWVNGVGHCVGGWGFEVSDDGSAAQLGRSAIRTSLHSHDGLKPTSGLTQAVMAHFGGQPSDIVAWVNEAKPKDYGTLAPMVFDFAHQGDPVAVDLVEKAAHDLGRYLARLHAIGAPKTCLFGGMAAPLTPWLSPWAKTLLAPAQHDALEGAILLAHGAKSGFTAESIS